VINQYKKGLHSSIQQQLIHHLALLREVAEEKAVAIEGSLLSLMKKAVMLDNTSRHTSSLSSSSGSGASSSSSSDSKGTEK
jgi:hypothetical protein